MKTIKNQFLRIVTTMMLLLTMIAGLAASLGKEASAASHIGEYKVTLINTDGRGSTQEKWIAANAYAYFTLPSYTSNQYVSFLGWKCSQDNKTYKGGTRIFVNSNKTFTGVWKSYARFYTWQGGLITQKAVTTGSTYGTLPSAPAREGYTFLGWFTSDGIEIKAGTTVTRGYVHDITARYKFEVTTKGGKKTLTDTQVNKLLKMKWPLPGDHSVASKFGPRNINVPGASTYHQGWDIGGALNANIVAALDGTVSYVGYEENGAGNYVQIDHGNGVKTEYFHCNEILVKKGDKVTAGQTIARVGSTGVSSGPHLHFGVQIDGVRIDPEYFLNKAMQKDN